MTNVSKEVTDSPAAASLKRAMTNLHTPIEETRAALDSLGISTYDENENIRDLNAVIGDLNSALSGVGKQI